MFEIQTIFFAGLLTYGQTGGQDAEIWREDAFHHRHPEPGGEGGAAADHAHKGVDDGLVQ